MGRASTDRERREVRTRTKSGPRVAASPRAIWIQELARTLDDTAMVFVHGPAGIGKSTVMADLAASLGAAGRPTTFIDGAAETAMTTRARLANALEGAGTTLVDGWEHLPCDEMVARWLRAARPSTGRLLVAGREPPSPELLALGPGLFRSFEVPALTPREADLLLETRGVATSRRPSLIARCDGNPLALHLLAATDDAREPVALDAVIERFLGALPESSQRDTLEALAFVPFANQDTLETLLGGDAAGSFGWLRRQSFVRTSQRGLHLHEALADALRRDLVWRKPSRARALVERAVRRIETLARDPSAHAPETRAWIMRVCSILLAACPHDDLALALGRGAPDPLTHDLHGQAATFIRETFGPTSASLFPRWLAAGAEGAVTFDREGRISALGVWMGAEATRRVDDPVVHALRRTLGEDARFCLQRFCTHRTLGFVPCVEVAALQDWTAECNWGAPNGSWYVTLVGDPAPWRALMAAIGGSLREDLPLTIDGHTLLPHVNLSAGPDVLAPRLAAMLRGAWRIDPSTSAAEPRSSTPAPTDWDALVRAALPKLVDVHALGRTALATRLGDDGPTLQARLYALIDETAPMRPGGGVRNALLASYGGAFAIDAAAAAHCGMSGTTFKRCKREGIERLVERLRTSGAD